MHVADGEQQPAVPAREFGLSFLSRFRNALFRRPQASSLPTADEQRAELVRSGWTVQPCHMSDLNFIVWRGHERAVLGHSYGEVGEYLLQRAQEIALKENAEAVIVTSETQSENIAKDAEVRSVLLLHYSEMSEMSDRIATMRRARRDNHSRIKNDLLKQEEIEQKVDFFKDADAAKFGAVLYRSKYMEVRHFPRSTGNLLICFGDVNDIPSEQEPIEVTATDGTDISVVTIRTTSPNFFPEHDFSRFLTECSANSYGRYARCWAWGVRQGAYGALKYAKRLGCDRTVVVSPVFSIDPADVLDHRYVNAYDQALHYNMSVKRGDAPEFNIAFQDPYSDFDSQQLALLKPVIDLKLFNLSFASDATGWLFSDPSSLREVLVSSRADDWPALTRFAGQARRRLHDRPFKMAYSLASRRPASAMRLVQKYGVGHIRAWSSVCFVLANHGCGPEVLPLLEAEADRLPTDVDLNVCAAAVALKLQIPEKALRYVAVGLSVDGMHPTYNWIKQTAQRMMP